MNKIELQCPGEAQKIVTIQHVATESFRGKGARIVATDTSSPPGIGTRICGVRIRGVSQRPEGHGRTLTVFFSNGAMGNKLVWDDLAPGDTLEIDVEFIVDSTFTCTIIEGDAK